MTNKFGNLFSFTSWGESHGEAIGCIIDGCPSLIDLEASDIQKYLDKRRPGQSKFTTQRQEKDEVKILSGVFEGKTTGTPISLIIYNQDQKSSDYNEIKDKFRPSHGDYTYWQKYGIRDYRGGGRSSARETAMRVAAGAIARKIIARHNIEITGYLTELGGIKIDSGKIDFSEINNNDFFCPDSKTVALWQDHLLNLRKNGDSAGAIIEIVAKNVTAGLGEPIYNKLDAAIASAMMGINAVKAVEIGLGFDIAKNNGSQVADEMIFEDNKVKFLANHSGGITAGISTGQDIIVRFAVKPTSSILTAKKTIDLENNNTEIATKGRHDPCVGIRAVPVGEAMLACVLADFLLLSKARK
jgi:chorismate synthase